MPESQPYRLDWTKAETIEQLNEQLTKALADADEMFQILFDNQTEATAPADDSFLVTQVFS